MNDDDFSDFQGKPQNRYQAFDDLMLGTHSQQQVHSGQNLSTNHQIIEDEFTEFHAPSANDIHPVSKVLITNHNTHPTFPTQLITNNNQQYIPNSELFRFQNNVGVNSQVAQPTYQINQISLKDELPQTQLESEEDFEDFQQPVNKGEVDQSKNEPQLKNKFDHFNEIVTETKATQQYQNYQQQINQQFNHQQEFSNDPGNLIIHTINPQNILPNTNIQQISEDVKSQLDGSFNSYEEPTPTVNQDNINQNQKFEVQIVAQPFIVNQITQLQINDSQSVKQDLLNYDQMEDTATISYINTQKNGNTISQRLDNTLSQNLDFDEFEDGEIVDENDSNTQTIQKQLFNEIQVQQDLVQIRADKINVIQNGNHQELCRQSSERIENQADEFEDGEVIDEQSISYEQNVIEKPTDTKFNKYNSDLFDDLIDNQSPVLKLQLYANQSVVAPIQQIDINQVIGLSHPNQVIEAQYQSFDNDLKLTDLNIMSEQNQQNQVILINENNDDEDFDGFEEPSIIHTHNNSISNYRLKEVELLVQTNNNAPKTDYSLCFVESDNIGDTGVNIKELLNTQSSPQNIEYQNQNSIPKPVQMTENIKSETTPQFNGKVTNELKNDHFNMNTHVEVSNKIVPQRHWRHKIQLPIGDDADCLDEFCQELSELELDIYVGAIKEYKQLVRDIQQLKIQKQESLDKEEFEVLIVIRDTLRAKEPIAQQLKQRVLYIANLMNLFKERPLSVHIQHYNGGHILLDLQPELIGNEDFINRLQKELQKATSVLKLIKLRNQLEKIKYEQKYLNFINGLKKIIGMSHRFSSLQTYIDNANEALSDIKIEKKQYVIDQEYLLEHTIVPFLHSREATLQYCKLCFQIGQLVQFQGSWHHVCCVNFYYSSI